MKAYTIIPEPSSNIIEDANANQWHGAATRDHQITKMKRKNMNDTLFLQSLNTFEETNRNNNQRHGVAGIKNHQIPKINRNPTPKEVFISTLNTRENTNDNQWHEEETNNHEKPNLLIPNLNRNIIPEMKEHKQQQEQQQQQSSHRTNSETNSDIYDEVIRNHLKLRHWAPQMKR